MDKNKCFVPISLFGFHSIHQAQKKEYQANNKQRIIQYGVFVPNQIRQNKGNDAYEIKINWFYFLK